MNIYNSQRSRLAQRAAVVEIRHCLPVSLIAFIPELTLHSNVSCAPSTMGCVGLAKVLPTTQMAAACSERVAGRCPAPATSEGGSSSRTLPHPQCTTLASTTYLDLKRDASRCASSSLIQL